MTCDHASCTDTATVRCRMGDGTWKHGNTRFRQTYVRYCDPHYQEVATLFVLCDVGCEDGPNGLSRPGQVATTMTALRV